MTRDNESEKSIDRLEENLKVKRKLRTPQDLVINTKEIAHKFSDSIKGKPEAKNGTNKVKKGNGGDLNECSTWKERLWISSKFMIVYIKVFSIFLAFLSVYWGSMYNRETRYKNLQILIYSDDTAFKASNGREIQPLIQENFYNLVLNNETINPLGGWEITNITIKNAAAKHNISVRQELTRLVHHQKAWASIYITPNATQMLYEAILNANESFIPTMKQLIDVTYEQGRHYSSLTQYVTKHLETTQEAWISYYVPNVYKGLIANMNSTEKLNLLSNTSLTLLATNPTFNLINISPKLSPVSIGPAQIGLVYAQMFSFHQFNFSLQIHQYLKDKLKFKHYLVYRIISSHCNLFILALVYCLMTLAYQVPVNLTFGQSGFLVYWMIMYLFIAACGSLNELAVSIILHFDKKPLMPLWVVFTVVANIAPTFAAMELSPQFYRYGYALPMYNAFEAIKVIFFNTWKGHLGRHIGILVTWIVVCNSLLIAFIIYLNRLEKAKKLAEKEAKLQQQEKELQLWMEKYKHITTPPRPNGSNQLNDQEQHVKSNINTAGNGPLDT